MERWYVLEVTISSSGTEERKFTPYDLEDTALRKFHEVFSSKIGAGPTKIMALLLDRNLAAVRTEIWPKNVSYPGIE